MKFNPTEVLKEFDEKFYSIAVMGKGAIKAFFSHALQEAFEAGEAHGAVKERDWDKLKEIISDHTNRAYREFNEDYFEYGSMRSVGVVSDNIIEDYREALQGEKKESRDTK